jgi:hypothetical protein
MIVGAVVIAWSMVAIVVAIAAGGSGLGPDEALQKLMAGNKRFVQSQITHRSLTISEARA